jgi:hypothetical protein
VVGRPLVFSSSFPKCCVLARSGGRKLTFMTKGFLENGSSTVAWLSLSSCSVRFRFFEASEFDGR